MRNSTLAFWRWPLHWQILLGLAVGAALGFLSASLALDAAAAQGDPKLAPEIVQQRHEFAFYDLIGDLFLNGLKLIIIPLITSSIVLAVASIAAQRGFGRLGLKTLVYYLASSLLAVVTGLTLINLFAPGVGEQGQGILVGRDVSQFGREAEILAEKTGQQSGASFINVFRQMIPSNIFEAGVEQNLLGLIVVSMVVGFFVTRLHGDIRETMERLWRGIYEVSMMITDLVLRLAPIGVAMLVAVTISDTYARLAPEDRFAEFFGGVVAFSLVVLLALGLHFLVTMSLILGLLVRANPIRHYRAMAPALMTAFSTASSSATLPVTLDCAERRAGVSNRTAGFVLPLGATVNMDGTALYECVAAVFICQAMGVDLTLGQQFFIVVVALLTSVGVAGVPSASLVAIVVILQSIENQLTQQGVSVSLVAAIPILLVFDRLLDMCRTAVNIFGDSVGAAVIARTEGETPLQPIGPDTSSSNASKAPNPSAEGAASR